MLAEVIWRKGGFRFWHRRMKQENLTYVYFCSQDGDRRDARRRSGFRVTATLHSNRHSKIVHWQSPCDTLTMRRTWTGMPGGLVPESFPLS
ncbi:hypothetical protein V1506DRAFT_534877 [Lipomyces tetrasporus]